MAEAEGWAGTASGYRSENLRIPGWKGLQRSTDSTFLGKRTGERCRAEQKALFQGCFVTHFLPKFGGEKGTEKYLKGPQTHPKGLMPVEVSLEAVWNHLLYPEDSDMGNKFHATHLGGSEPAPLTSKNIVSHKVIEQPRLGWTLIIHLVQPFMGK